MAVEIHVLSGSQQGRCLRFDGDRILVGDVAAADLRFDPEREAGARGKIATLTLDDEEGWRISNEGDGVWLVNQTTVEPSQSHRLRSEDLVRVSEVGPDFCFRIVAGPHGCAIPATVAPASVAGQTVSASQEAAIPATDAALENLLPSPPAPLPEGEGSMSRASLFTRLAAAIGGIFQPSPTAHAEESGRALPSGPAADVVSAETMPGGESGTRLAATIVSPPQSTPTPGPSRENGQGEPLHDAACAAVMADSPVCEVDLAEPFVARKRRRRTNPLVKLIGLIVSGLFGIFLGYCILCCIRGREGDFLGLFYKTPPSLPAAHEKVEPGSDAPAAAYAKPTATRPAVNEKPNQPPR
jgi:hypothetical protein